MQTAFFRTGAFPPPAAGPNGLSGRNRARAGGATDARIAAVVQGVIRHLACANIGPDFLSAPVGERVEFQEPVFSVIGLDRKIVAGNGLRAPQSGDPRPLSGERPAQRLALSHCTAGPAQPDARAESVHTVIVHV